MSDSHLDFTADGPNGLRNDEKHTLTDAEVEELKRKTAADGISRCLGCGKEMRHNVPRLGAAGGYVHADTGSPLCGPAKPVQWQLAAESHGGSIADDLIAELKATKMELVNANAEIERLTEIIENAFDRASKIDKRLIMLSGDSDQLACDLNLHKDYESER